MNSVRMNSDFTEGKIVPKLVRFVFPILFAMLIQSLYGAVDLLIVGQFSDAANVSAVAVGSQIMHTLTFVITDLAAGTAILLGQYIGQKNTKSCGETVGATICFFGILGAVISVVMQPLAAPVSHLMNVPEEAFAQTVAYTRICCGGTLFIVAYNILGSVFRGIGDAKMPLITVLIAAVFLFLYGLLYLPLSAGAVGQYFLRMIDLTAIISLGLAIFNLLPFPPLDGSKIVF